MAALPKGHGYLTRRQRLLRCYLHLDWTAYNLTLSIPKNSIDIAYQPIPEPGVMALIVAGAGVWVLRRKNFPNLSR